MRASAPSNFDGGGGSRGRAAVPSWFSSHGTLGIAGEPLEELVAKTVGEETWPDGLIDLLGHPF